MDAMVLSSQQFINQTYGGIAGIPTVDEDGQTGWATMYALTRCLQYELGLASLSDNFGPTTLATLTAKYPSIGSGGPIRIIRIIQAALWCKGYDGGEWASYAQPLGLFTDTVSQSVQHLKANAGVSGVYPGDAMVPKLFKALLTMDAYTIVGNGTSTIRSIQQWLNAGYVQHTNFFIIPCDGNFSRDVQKALMLAVQFQVGISDASATGVFGPATQAGIKANLLSVGSTGRWVQLFTAAMVFNQRPGVAFADTFSVELSAQASDFQSFVKLSVTGKGDFQTWASLLVSTGDTTRKGAAVDCVDEITVARAQTLTANGYSIVGRYLCNVPGTTLNKMIQLGELGVIAANGLRCFPIYQTYGDSADYFRFMQGASDALEAIDRVKFYGFKPGTRIYFAVDFDALDQEVTDHVIPYFRGIKETMDAYGTSYEIGIYGPRNICSRVAAEGLSTASFVSDMSTGYSGNLGFPMPQDWAFDQIATVDLGSGSGAIEIDNDIVSGRDAGQASFDEGEWVDEQDVDFDFSLKAAMLADLQQYLPGQGVPEDGGDNATTVNTTTESLDQALVYDALMTGLARALKMRKALIMTVIFWEVRKLTMEDLFADEGVEIYYTSGDWDPTDVWIKSDGSTGMGQIFAWVAIEARNYCIEQGIITGTIMDRNKPADIWTIWQKLHGDDPFNISTAAHVLIQAATDIRWHVSDTPVQIPRPSLDYSDENSRLVLRRYQGLDVDGAQPTDPGPNRDSFIKLGIYQIFEKYFAPLRG